MGGSLSTSRDAIRSKFVSFVLLARGGTISAELLPPEIAVAARHPNAKSDVGETEDREAERDPAEEKGPIIDALAKCSGNQTRAAELLGITRRVLIKRIERYNLPRPRRVD